jgi:hypothetical protein
MCEPWSMLSLVESASKWPQWWKPVVLLGTWKVVRPWKSSHRAWLLRSQSRCPTQVIQNGLINDWIFSRWKCYLKVEDIKRLFSSRSCLSVMGWTLVQRGDALAKLWEGALTEYPPAKRGNFPQRHTWPCCWAFDSSNICIIRWHVLIGRQ